MRDTKLAGRFAGHEEISEAFSILAADELAHRAQFEAVLKELPPDEGIMTPDEKHRYLCAMARSEFFKGDAELTTTLDNLENLQEALTHALGFEKATLGFYLAVQDVLGQDEALEAIIQAEKGHVARQPSKLPQEHPVVQRPKAGADFIKVHRESFAKRDVFAMA